MNGTHWSADYGTCVLFAAFVCACVAVWFLRMYDRYEAKRAEYLESWNEERNQ